MAGVIRLPIAERKGIQPIVTVKASNGNRADVKAGKFISILTKGEEPKDIGKAEGWSFES